MKKYENIKGTEALIISLLENGVDTIFGYPGGTIMPFYDDLYDHADKINHILVRHEQGAVHAAEGYARSTGKTGVCVATSGPGATNFVTGIADAMMDSTPIVCITAQINADKLGTNFFQEADMVGITRPITKWNYQITDASEIAETMAKAFYIAQSGKPGPVVISITKNAQTERTDFCYDPDILLKGVVKERPKASEDEVKKAAELLNGAKRPLIVAGHGVIISNAEKELAELAEKGNIPVATTLLGISALPSDFDKLVGTVGMHGNIAPNAMTQEADVLLAVGMRFSDRVTGETHGYANKAKIIHIEIDRAEIDKNIKSDLAINADAKETLAQIAKKVEYRDRKEWFDFARKENSYEHDKIIAPELASSDYISMGQVVAKISEKTDAGAIVVTDVGQNQMFSARYSKFKNSKSWVTSGGLGTMGFGLPAAIGAKIGNPEREVVAIVGDGGFQMNIQELGTVMQSGIGVKIVLMNNHFLGMVRQWQELFYDKRYAFTRLDNPDFQQIAAGYRIASERVVDPADLDSAIERMLKTPGAYLLEVAVKEEENVFPMIPAGATLSGIIYEKPEKK